MHISKIKVSEEFNNSNGRHLWIGCDVIVNDGEDEMLAKKKAMDFIAAVNKEASESINNNRSLPIIEVERFSITQDEADKEFEEIKSQLELIEFREDAQAYLDSTNFGFTIEARKLIIKKPLKNKV